MTEEIKKLVINGEIYAHYLYDQESNILHLTVSKKNKILVRPFDNESLITTIIIGLEKYNIVGIGFLNLDAKC